MRTRKTLLTLFLAVVLIAGGLVVASNMGFKLQKPLQGPAVDNWLSVPYFNNYSVANDICTDVGANATLVSLFDTATSLRQDWTCPFGNNFPVTSGEGFFVRIGVASDDFTLVGSHDPSLAIPQGGFTVTNTDYVLSWPFHAIASVANDVCGEVGGSATLVSRFDTASGLRQDWTCPFGNNFALNIGEAIAVRVNAASGAVVPAHY